MAINPRTRVAINRQCSQDSDLRAIPPFAALKAFDAFGRSGGIRKAAASLGLDHAVISRHLRSLESWTSANLIDRSAGRLTPEGERYFDAVSAAMQILGNATRDLMRPKHERRLIVWSIPGLASQWLSHQLVSFDERYPEMEIELRPSDIAPDLMHGEAGVDIRFFGDAWETVPADPLLQTFEIARPRIMAVASPEFLASAGALNTPFDLLEAPLLHEEHDEQWRAWFGSHGIAVPERLPGDRLWHAHLALTAAKHGRGVALASSFLLGSDLSNGRLVEVSVPGDDTREVVLGGYVLIARADRWRWPILVALRRWLVRGAATA